MQKHAFTNVDEIETKIATNHSLISSENRNHKNHGENKDMGNIDNDDEVNENFNVEIEANAKCSKHSLPIHSYIKTNKVLLWSDCIKEGDYDKSKYKPITQVVKETRGTMHSYKLKLNQSLLQIKRFKDHIDRVIEENRKKVTSKLDLHFKSIYKLISKSEKKAFKKLSDQFKKQDKMVDALTQDLKEIENVVWGNKSKVQEYLNSKDEDIVPDIETIEKIVVSNIDIIPKISIPNFKVNFISQEGDLNKIDIFLNTMYQYTFKANDVEETSKLLNDSFKIENNWICHTCNHQNKTILNRKKEEDVSEEVAKSSHPELYWVRCKSYKPMEFYPSFYHNQSALTPDELDILKMRRTNEK